MTNLSFKNITRIGVTGLLVLNSVIPTVVMAQGNNPGSQREGVQATKVEARDASEQKRDDRACERIIALAEKMGPRLADKGRQISEKRIQQSERRRTQVSEREGRISENRLRWEARRGNLHTRLSDLMEAGPDGAGMYVDAFKKAVDSAVSARRDAMDSANAMYHEGLTALLAERSRAVENGKMAYENGIRAALNQAIDGCNGDSDPAIVRDNLRKEIEAAKTIFKEARVRVDSFKEAHQELVANRKAAFDDAKEVFLGAMQTARDEFKRAISDSEGGDGDETDSGTDTE